MDSSLGTSWWAGVASDDQDVMEARERVVWEGRVIGRPLGLWLISEMLYKVVQARCEEEALIPDHRSR